MNKLVGLSQNDKKMLEFGAFPKGNNCALLYHQAKAFYSAFKLIFGDGYEIVLGHRIPKLHILGPCIVNYHFAVELVLKSLLSLKKIKFNKTHDLLELLSASLIHYPSLSEINANVELRHLLNEISHIGIRYAEGTVCLRQNIEENKMPLQELYEAMEYIFTTLIQSFENARNI